MANKGLMDVINDPNYINANPETKKAIFDKYSAMDTNYTGANPATQEAIRKKFGIEESEKELNVKDTAPETTDKKGGYYLKKFAEQATALPRAAARELLKYPGQSKSGEPLFKGLLLGGAGELVKGAGAVTELAFPETGKDIQQVGKDITKAGEEINPLASEVGKIGSYAIPYTGVGKGVQAAKGLIGLEKATTMGGRAVEAGISGGITSALTTPTEEGRGQAAAIAGVGGALLGPAVETVAKAPEKLAGFIGSRISPTLSNLLKSYTGVDLIELRASQLKKQATDAAKQALKTGDNESARIAIGENLVARVDEQKLKRADELLKKQQQQTTEQQLKGILSQQKTAEKQALESASMPKDIFSAPPKTESVASSIQGDVVSQAKKLRDSRMEEYNNLYPKAVQEARNKEATGQFWQTTEDGQYVKDYWQSKINKGELGSSSEKAVKKLLDDLFDLEKPKSITAIDEEIRMLGDKSSRESLGYGAISDKLAGELRKSITKGEIQDIVDGKYKELKIGKGLYEWIPSFGEAKAKYAQALDAESKFMTKSAQKVTGDETDPLNVLNEYFTSSKSFSNLTEQVGQDKAYQYGTQYAVSKLQDKNPKQMTEWLKDPKNGWVDKVPGLRKKIETEASRVSQLTSKAEKAGADVQRLQKEIPKVKPQLEKTWNEKVDKFAMDEYKNIYASDRPENRLKNMLLSEKETTKEQKRALSAYIGQDAEMRQKVPNALKEILLEEANKSPKSVLNALEKALPGLEGTGLIKKSEIDSLRTIATKIVEADAKDYTLAKSKKSERAINYIYTVIAANAGLEGFKKLTGNE